jgi:hypothetical protein
MRTMGALIMGGGVWVILGSPDLSGATLLGAVVFLLGLYVAQRAAADHG